MVGHDSRRPDKTTAGRGSLAAFHALTGKQIGDLKATDVVDGRLTIGGRVIPLADPVRGRLAAWLDHRAHTWPATQNPYLLVNRKTAPRITRSNPDLGAASTSGVDDALPRSVPGGGHNG